MMSIFTKCYFSTPRPNGYVIKLEIPYAAKVAAACRDGGYDDWYLPSKYELNLMFKQRYIIGEFSVYTGPADNSNKAYWSSSEFGLGTAWSQRFDTGWIVQMGAAYGAHVRAIRSF